MNQVPRTIVIFNHHHLGDLLGSFPALLAIREKWPEARIINIAPSGPLGLLQNTGLTDLCIPQSRNLKTDFKAMMALRREKPDLAICFSGTRRVALMARFCGAKIRAGFSPTKHDWAWTTKVPKKGPPALQHDLKLVEVLGCTVSKRDYVGLLKPSEGERAVVTSWCVEQGVNGQIPLIGLNMGASVARRQWGVENFAKVAEELNASGAQIVVFGGPGDLPSIEQLKTLVSTPVLVAAGQFSPRESAALMEKCAVVVTGDTGPMHLAMAVDTRVVALFGLVAAAYRLPQGYVHIGLEHNAECQQLSQPRCRYENTCACLNSIKPSEVVIAVRTLISSTM